MSSVQRYKVLVDVELQMKSLEVMREMKRELDQMDSKLTKFQQSGLGAAAGVSSVGVGGPNAQKFLANQGLLEGGAEGDFSEALEGAINDSLNDAIQSEFKPGGRFDIREMLLAGGFDATSIDSWFNMAKNPTGFFQIFFTRALPILGGILTAKEIAEFIFQELTARGRPFDLTFRRTIEQELIKLRGRELRQQIRVGERQAIFVSEAGSSHVLESVNTLELVRNREIFDLDAFRVRKGYQY